MTREYTIKGMNCSHYQARVTKSISLVKGVKQVGVNFSTGKATVEGEHNALVKAKKPWDDRIYLP